MTAIVCRGDAGNLHLPDETVDLIVTSPPYFGLRSYQDGGEHYAEQIGAEATPAEYLDALMACTAEWMRVLKPGGSIFVNLGDKYAQPGKGERTRHGVGSTTAKHGDGVARHVSAVGQSYGEVRGKSLMLLPQRYAIRCIDELGLILRAEIIWQKPNGLPESVTDRVRRSHEQVFHFVKQPRYYSAVDEVREPHLHGEHMAKYSERAKGYDHKQNRDRHDNGATIFAANPLGKLPGSVWSIPTSPLRVPESLGIDHFAAYPPELVRRIVLGWSPREVCTACGEGRRPVVAKPGLLGGDNNPASRDGSRTRSTLDGGSAEWAARIAKPDYISGYSCACPDTAAPSTPGVVLDPFGGTGTTALVASVHGRVGISVDLSADYCRLAQWRTADEKQRAKAAGVKPKAPKKPKPEPMGDVLSFDPIPAGQLDLLDGDAA